MDVPIFARDMSSVSGVGVEVGIVPNMINSGASWTITYLILCCSDAVVVDQGQARDTIAVK